MNEPTNTNYYNNSYFEWQKNCGDFGGWANLIKFEDFIKFEFNVVDYGCGGAYLLKNIKAKGKLGAEINPSAREQAKKNEIDTVSSLEEVPDNWADIIISNHALEHVQRPLDEVKSAYKKLRTGGKAIFVIPCETITCAYKEKDLHRHLYSWGPSTLGNLFSEAGFKILESSPFTHKWPPYYQKIAQLVGPVLFHKIAKIYANIDRSSFQVRVIAEKV
jgi:SAM-dependent methyltransferase